MIQKERVTEILDGDTFKTHGRTVRLARVDAPEKEDPGGDEVTDALKNLIEDEIVSIETVGFSHGRDVAEVWIGDVSVNDAIIEMVSNL